MTKRNSSNGIPHRLATRLAHAGRDPEAFHGFINPPVYHGSTVLFPDYETMKNRDQRYTYGTRATPTTDALTDIINELEGSAGTILVPSGLAAVSVPLLAFTKAGDHVLVLDSCYGPTRAFCDDVLTRFGVEVEYYDPRIGSGIEKLMRPNTSVVFTESPGSNTFEVQDIPAISKIAHNHNVIVMMDNTWATPLLFKALDFGVDISIHALTKYPAGHSDLVLGSVSANERHWPALYRCKERLGVCANGDDCALVLRGMRTMQLRMREHEKNALLLAHWLEAHAQCAEVLHPGLESHPDYALFSRDFSGSSGLFGFVLKHADEEAAGRFLDALELFGRGYSWGGYESLAVVVSTSDRTIAHPPKGGKLIRLQVGLEDVEDLKNDLENGFSAALAKA